MCGVVCCMSVVVIVMVYVVSVSIVNVCVLLLCAVCEFVTVLGGSAGCVRVRECVLTCV